MANFGVLDGCRLRTGSDAFPPLPEKSVERVDPEHQACKLGHPSLVAFVTPITGGEPIFVHIRSFGNGGAVRPARELVSYELSRDTKGRFRLTFRVSVVMNVAGLIWIVLNGTRIGL